MDIRRIQLYKDVPLHIDNEERESKNLRLKDHLGLQEP